MANVSRRVQIETKQKHDLSISFQSVAGNKWLNVGPRVGFAEEAIALQNEIHGLFEQWFMDFGYDLKRAYDYAEHQLKQAEQS